MADNNEVRVVVDQEALRAQVEQITSVVKQEAVDQLLAAASALNPNWLTDRDRQVAEKAVADYKATQKQG